ncbi:hypothetical protein PM082_022555 [Marasmius tenuissimus]|nr:hypothetical protein PM082_022555 [Marasmius tenuissimus]
MIRHFYDVLLKDDFHDLFRNTAVGRSIFEDGEEIENRSACFVIMLDFAKLKPLDPEFDFDVEVNKQLQEFLSRYSEFFSGSNIQIGKSASETLSNILIKTVRLYPRPVVFIDDYDSPWQEIRRQKVFRRAQGRKFENQYCRFLQKLAIWNRGVVPLVVFCGRDRALSCLSHWVQSLRGT